MRVRALRAVAIAARRMAGAGDFAPAKLSPRYFPVVPLHLMQLWFCFPGFTMSRTLHIVVTAAALIAILFIADAWRSARRDSAQLTATLVSQKALIEQAAEREQQRNAQLAAALASIAAEKRRVQTPQQALEAIPSVLPPLPLPLTILPPNLTQSLKQGDMTPASAAIPQSDLKP